MNRLISQGKRIKVFKKKEKKERNDNMLEQFPEAILEIFSKNTRQEVKSLVQVTHGMLNYHFISLRVKKGLYVQVASLVLCFFFSSSFFFNLFSHLDAF